MHDSSLTYLSPFNNAYFLFPLLKQSAKAVNNHEDKENKRDLKKEEKKTLELSESKKKLKPSPKSSQKDNGCLSTAVPFRASFIYTSCSRSSASPLFPRGTSACPDVQLFMWSSGKSSWPALHILETNRGGRHSPDIQLLQRELTAQIIRFQSRQVQEHLILHCATIPSSQRKNALPVMMITVWQVVLLGTCVLSGSLSFLIIHLFSTSGL